MNDEGTNREYVVRSKLIQDLVLGTPLIGFTFYQFFLFFSNNNRAFNFLVVVLLPFVVGYTLYFLFFTLKNARIWNRTLNTIEMQNGKVFLTTFGVLWFKEKRFEYTGNPVTKVDFTWYGKVLKQGIKISTANKKELYLVKDYFDAFDEIETRILH